MSKTSLFLLNSAELNQKYRKTAREFSIELFLFLLPYRKTGRSFSCQTKVFLRFMQTLDMAFTVKKP
jgi:hypothetical protein